MIHLALTIASALFLIWFGVWAFAFVATILVATWRYVLGAVVLMIAAGFIAYWSSSNQKPAPSAGAAPPAPPLATPPPYEALQASVATAISASRNDKAPPIPEFSDSDSRLRFLRWLGVTSDRLKARVPDWLTRKELLQTVWYESRRSGLDPSLVLALIATTSNYRKFYVSDAEARGYMGVNPVWTNIIGDGDPARLFHMQTNLRFGTVILRHYLDQNQGDPYMSLRHYAVENFRLAPSDPKVGAFVDRLFVA